jgi:hypothetical protein
MAPGYQGRNNQGQQPAKGHNQNRKRGTNNNNNNNTSTNTKKCGACNACQIPYKDCKFKDRPDKPKHRPCTRRGCSFHKNGECYIKPTNDRNDGQNTGQNKKGQSNNKTMDIDNTVYDQGPVRNPFTNPYEDHHHESSVENDAQKKHLFGQHMDFVRKHPSSLFGTKQHSLSR